MSDYKITLPIYGVRKPTKSCKNGAITFNWALGCNNHVYNAAKKKFKSMIDDQLSAFDPIDGKLSIHYAYYAKRNSGDLDGFVSIPKKWLQDALTEKGLIVDDHARIIVRNSESYAGIDKNNPRIEAFVSLID